MRARDISTSEVFSLKTSATLKISELDTIIFDVEKEWTFKKHKYASGIIRNLNFILSNIKTKELLYESEGIWNPYDSFGEEAEEYFFDYIEEGYRESFEFKDYTGYGFYQENDDPVFNAVELKEAGQWKEAYSLLTRLWEDYPECIDALVHIGNLYFDSKLFLHRCYNCYKGAVDIIERWMPENFDGLFLWINIENRPYLRALNGLCLTLWRMKEYEESYKIADKLLRLCPTDNLGVRFIIDKIKNQSELQNDEKCC